MFLAIFIVFFCFRLVCISKTIKMNKEIRSRIEWDCGFVNKVPMIKERKFKNWMLLGNTNDQYQKENGKENKRWQRSILH